MYGLAIRIIPQSRATSPDTAAFLQARILMRKSVRQSQKYSQKFSQNNQSLTLWGWDSPLTLQPSKSFIPTAQTLAACMSTHQHAAALGYSTLSAYLLCTTATAPSKAKNKAKGMREDKKRKSIYIYMEKHWKTKKKREKRKMRKRKD